MTGKRVQRILTLTMVFIALSTTTVAANSLWGNYNGYSKARVIINNVQKEFSSSEVPGFIVKGTTVLPLRTLADSLHALIRWDDSDKTVSVYKPNVHMIVAEEVVKEWDKKDKKDVYHIRKPFGAAIQGETVNFVVFLQVDNLKTGISSIKFTLKAPSGNYAATVDRPISEHMENFWLPTPFSNVKFSEYGTYTLKVSVQLEGSSEYQVVSEKQILSQ